MTRIRLEHANRSAARTINLRVGLAVRHIFRRENELKPIQQPVPGQQSFGVRPPRRGCDRQRQLATGQVIQQDESPGVGCTAESTRAKNRCLTSASKTSAGSSSPASVLSEMPGVDRPAAEHGLHHLRGERLAPQPRIGRDPVKQGLRVEHQAVEIKHDRADHHPKPSRL